VVIKSRGCHQHTLIPAQRFAMPGGISRSPPELASELEPEPEKPTAAPARPTPYCQSSFVGARVARGCAALPATPAAGACGVAAGAGASAVRSAQLLMPALVCQIPEAGIGIRESDSGFRGFREGSPLWERV